MESVADVTSKFDTLPSYQSPTYDELLELMTHAIARLGLNWSVSKHWIVSSRLAHRDSRFVEAPLLCSRSSFKFKLCINIKVMCEWG